MLQEQDKLIWFKKAKCAGTSFESVLQKYGAIYYVRPTTTIEDLTRPENKVICIREGLFPYGKTRVRGDNNQYSFEGSRFAFEVRKKLSCSFLPKNYMFQKFPEFMASHQKFSIVRNPYDKFVSSWKYLKSTRDMELESVLRNLPRKRNFHDWVHITQLQSDCLTDLKGNIAVDKIVYMERSFEQEISAILESLGVPETSIPRQNKSVRKVQLKEYLTPEAQLLVHDIYERDFVSFGYSESILELAPRSPNPATSNI